MRGLPDDPRQWDDQLLGAAIGFGVLVVGLVAAIVVYLVVADSIIWAIGAGLTLAIVVFLLVSYWLYGR